MTAVRSRSCGTYPSPLSGVLFDLDDTLLDHRGAVNEALSRWSRLEGLEVPELVLQDRWLQLETTYYRRFQAGELTKAEQRRARIRGIFPQRRLDDDEADRVFDRYWTAYVDAWRAFPDAVSALHRATQAGLATGILTNGDGDDQRRKVVAAGLAGTGVPVFASSELQAAKPDPRAFAMACARLGVRPETCLFVGDSMENDVAGARAAAMPVVLLDRHGRHLEVDVPRITSLDELQFVSLPS